MWIPVNTSSVVLTFVLDRGCGTVNPSIYLPFRNSYPEQRLKQQRLCLQVSIFPGRFRPAAASPTAYLDYRADYWYYIRVI
jgi:hypothetical protein